MGKSIRKFAAVTRVGIDLAKKIFQVHAVDAKVRVRLCCRLCCVNVAKPLGALCED